MTTTRSESAKRTIRKAQQTWRRMSARARALAQPEGRSRRKPGSGGRGNYFHIEIRPRAEFKTFRTQDVGARGGIERVAGKRGSGSWDTQKWLIGKRHAHVEDGRLVGDSAEAAKVLRTLGSAPRHLSGDRFVARPRPDVPEHAKPTPAQRRAQQRNIRKAQAARRGV
jgi:hypothetical protein